MQRHSAAVLACRVVKRRRHRLCRLVRLLFWGHHIVDVAVFCASHAAAQPDGDVSRNGHGHAGCCRLGRNTHYRGVARIRRQLYTRCCFQWCGDASWDGHVGRCSLVAEDGIALKGIVACVALQPLFRGPGAQGFPSVAFEGSTRRYFSRLVTAHDYILQRLVICL